MKKNTLTIIITIVLAVIVAYLFYTSKEGTIRQELKDFAIEDTSAITKIFLADMSNHQVTLEKIEPGHWIVNGKYKARKDLIEILLKTMKNLEVKSPVAKAARENVIKRIATGAVKVEVYQNNNDEPNKVYYVGGATQSQMGTYMLLENSSNPFIMNIPYFSGYLTTRYNTDEYEWRDKTVFNYQFKDIAGVKLEYTHNPEYSFSIMNTGNWTYTLRSLQNDELIANYDTNNLNIYLTFFRNIQFEGFVRNKDTAFRDSIVSYPPFCTLTVTDMSGNTTKVKAFLKPVPKGTTDLNDNPIEYDVDRMYALIDTRHVGRNYRSVDENQLVTIQYFVFDKLFLVINDFTKNIASQTD